MSMSHIDELYPILNGIFSLNKARLNCLIQLIISVIKMRTVNLKELAQAFSGKATSDSAYRRIQRFFREVSLDSDFLGKLILCLFGGESGWYLALDRTNWKFGKTDINILMLAIVWQGIAIPCMWTLLPKPG